MKNLAALSVFAILLLSTVASAQPTADSRSTNILDLIDRLADEIDKEIIVDPRLAPEMGIFTTAEDPDYESLLAALRIHGYVTVETADQILIVPEQNMRTVASLILVEDDSRVSDHDIVTRVIKLPDLPNSSTPVRRTEDGEVEQIYTPTTALSAAFLVPVLRPMMGTAAQLAAPPGTNSLILVDYYDNVRRIEAIIEQIVEGLED